MSGTHHLDTDQELARIDPLLDLVNDLEDHPALVLERSSKLVSPLVDSGREELGE